MKILHYIGAIGIAGNQLLNALIGGNPQMSLSARAGFSREAGHRSGRMACRFLNTINPDGDGPYQDHCDMAIRAYWERHTP